MYSMTGYGKAEYKDEEIEITVEIKTVNNRFLDLLPKYPKCFLALDDLIRKSIQSKLTRGRVELFITYKNNSEAGKNVSVDLGLAKSYMSAAKVLKENFPLLDDDYTLVQLMKAPDVLSQDITEEDLQKLSPILENTIFSACDSLNKMRLFEGEKLKVDLLKRVDAIDELVKNIKIRAPMVVENYRVKLAERIKQALDGVNYDETRLLQEVAIYADKTNIDEELTRLSSHIAQFRKLVELADAGKKLDFLIQEFNREANTICSKSNDVEVTNYALQLKCEIEKIREQIQNIE